MPTEENELDGDEETCPHLNWVKGAVLGHPYRYCTACDMIVSEIRWRELYELQEG